MSPRKLMAIECVTLLALGAFLMGNDVVAGCGDTPPPPPDTSSVLQGPSFLGETQTGTTLIEDAMGVVVHDLTDQRSDVTVPTNLSEGTAGSHVVLELDGDGDDYRVACLHDNQAGEKTECLASVAAASFPIAQQGDVAKFRATLTVPETNGSFLTSAIADFGLDCGLGQTVEQLETATSTTSPRTVDLSVPVDPNAAACSAEIVFRAEATGGVAFQAIQIASFQALDVGGCAQSSECTDPEEPICGADGICHDGGTAQRCEVQSLHCDGATHPYCTGQNYLGFNGCSTGQFSPCIWDGQCAAGYFCFFGLCEPTSPADPADCAPDENFVAGFGGVGACLQKPEGDICETCWASGGCVAADGSGNGICQSGLCTRFGLRGDSCNGTCEQCEFGYYCDGASDTCQDQLPLGASCGQNDACQGYPQFNSCIGGVCAPKNGLGDPCEESVDCSPRLLCTGGVCG